MNMNIQNEEQMLRELGLSNANPFKTPEGYFDTLNDRIMDRIDKETAKTEDEEKETADQVKIVSMKQKQPVVHYAIRWAVAAAACLALVFIGVNYYEQENKNIAQNQTAVTEDYDDEYGEDMISYSMMDGSDVYCYLSGME